MREWGEGELGRGEGRWGRGGGVGDGADEKGGGGEGRGAESLSHHNPPVTVKFLLTICHRD